MAEHSNPQTWASEWAHYICPSCHALMPAATEHVEAHLVRCRRLSALLDAHEPHPHAGASGSVPTSPGDRPAKVRRELTRQELARRYDFGDVMCRTCHWVIIANFDSLTLDTLLTHIADHESRCPGRPL